MLVAPERIQSFLKEENLFSEDLFCTIHAARSDRIAVVFSSHSNPEPLGDWQRFGRGIVGAAALSMKPHVALDIKSDPNYIEIYPRVASEMAIPVIVKNGVTGVVNFESTDTGYFAGRESHFEKLASRLADYFELQAEKGHERDVFFPESSLLSARSGEGLDLEITAISDSLLKGLSGDPSLMHYLTPRKFEELIARLLADMGYEVTLTPFQKDGGYDILAEVQLETGRVLTLVECKQWSPDSHVGVEIVRNLYGVLGFKNATNAMLVTTSTFTKGARQMQDSVKYRLSLKTICRSQSG